MGFSFEFFYDIVFCTFSEMHRGENISCVMIVGKTQLSFSHKFENLYDLFVYPEFEFAFFIKVC